MNTKQKKQFNAPVGLASILLIFMTLCIISFAILSLVSAQADYRLSSKLADYTSTYYEQSNSAQKFIKDTDIILKEAYSKSADSKDYYAQLGATSCEKDFPISDTQSLHVEIEYLFPEYKDAPLYSINTYEVVTDDSSVTLDDSLQVIKD